MSTILATRKTQFGFGWTNCVHQTPRGLELDEVEKPEHTGTINKVLDAIYNDRNYNNSGSDTRTQWFIKVDGEWRKVRNDGARSWENRPSVLRREKEITIEYL